MISDFTMHVCAGCTQLTTIVTGAFIVSSEDLSMEKSTVTVTTFVASNIATAAFIWTVAKYDERRNRASYDAEHRVQEAEKKLAAIEKQMKNLQSAISDSEDRD